MKQISLLFLSFICCIILRAETPMATSYAGGSGTNDDPYQIQTLAQLRLLSETSEDWSKFFILTADINAADTKTWNGRAGFSRIGTPETKFTGIFNGNNYSIDNLYISNSNEGYGMFGYINGATIKYFGLTNCDVTPFDKGAALIGYASGSVIEGCFVTGSVNGTHANIVGGLVGVLSSSTMKLCYSACDVTSSTSLGNNFGGLAGITWGTSTIQDCFATGNIYCGSAYGGITGQVESSDASIVNCYFSGTVIFTNCVITSKNKGTITNCYFDQTINSGTTTLAKALASSDFSDKANFPDWNFGTVWHIGSLPGIDTKKRPCFWWQFDHFTVDITVNNQGSISGNATQYVLPNGETEEVTAIANEGYSFAEWQDENGTTVSTNNPIMLSGITSDTAIVAVFDTTYGGGSGTSEDPYKIANLAQLRMLSEITRDWDKYFILTADIDAADTKNWNDGKGFSPIGDVAGTGYRQRVPFTGVFDGNNHIISNLYINRGEQLLGLFGRIESGAQIKNTGLIDVSITGSTDIAGNIGALLGYAQGSNKKVCVSNCFVAGGTVVSKFRSVGGLIGTVNVAELNNCFAIVDVEGTERVGGLVGRVGATVSNFTNCYASSKCTGTTDVNGMLGSIEMTPVVKACYWDKEISGIANGGHSSITGLTTADFADAANFSGWDFSSAWKVIAVIEADTIKRPYFQWAYDHIVSFKLGENGKSIVGVDTQGVAHDSSSIEVLVTANRGYNFDEWRNAAGDSITNANPLTLTNVTQDSALTAIFEVTPYTLTFEAGENGTIYPLGDSKVTINDIVECRLIPDEGYIVSNVYLNDEIIPFNGNSFILTEIDSSFTIKVEFKEFDGVFFLNPLNDAYVYYNDNQPTRANTNYGLNDGFILFCESQYKNYCDGLIQFSNIAELLDLSETNSISDVISGVELDIYNKPGLTHKGENAYNLLWYPKEWDERTVTWNNAPAVDSDAPYKTIPANTTNNQDYSIDITDMFLNNYNADDDVAGFKLKFTDYNGDKKLYFASKENTSDYFPTIKLYHKDYYKSVLFKPSDNGSLEGNTSQFMKINTDTEEITAVPNIGFKFVEWQNAAGDSISANNPLTITNVTQDSTLIAVFEIDIFNIEFSADANGAISSGEANQKVTYGSDASGVAVIAIAGYHFDEWRNAAGDSITNENPLIVTNVSQDSSLIAIFEQNTYTVKFTSDENGTVSGETTQTVAYSSNATTVTANVSTGGYSFVEWQDESGNTVSINNPLILTNVTQDSVLKAIFTERYADGFGRSDNPYQIASLEQLKVLSESVGDWSKSFILTSDIDASDTRNWNISGTDTLGFSPIGDWDRGDRQKVTFTGSFDGNNHSISNLYINRAERFLGLFGCIEKDVVIKNIGLTDISITSNTNETAYAGAIVGYADGRYGEMKISNCFAAGGSIIAANKYVGGLIGDMNRIDLTNCFSNVDVEGNEVVGGLIGYAGYTLSSNIKNCYAAGKVSGNSNFGGFIGDNTSVTAIAITNCYYDSISTEQVKGTGSTQNNNLIALTTAQFADTSTFSDWDFESTWKVLALASIDSAIRPNLQWSYDHVVTFELGENGDSIAGAYVQGVTDGSNALEVLAIANAGYEFVKWQDSKGTEVSTDNPFTLTNVTHDSTITAVFKQAGTITSYTVKFGTDGNGTIKENAEQTIESGSSAAEVLAIANEGYEFVRWQDSKGSEVSTDNPFTLTNVTQDLTITAVFKQAGTITSYTVKFETDGNGTIKENAEQTIESGSNAAEVLAIANEGYEFMKWQDSKGTEVSTDNPFTLTNVTQDSTITAVFKQAGTIASYTVKFETDGNGTIKENAEQTIESGSDAAEVLAIANEGYEFMKWQDSKGTEVSTDNPFTLTNVTQDLTITAVFKQAGTIASYTVKFETDGNGTIKENAEQTIESGSSAAEVLAIANEGYEFVKWQDSKGTEVSTDNPFTLTNVTHDSTITAVFKQAGTITSYTVKFGTDGNGTIKENAEQTIESGSSAAEVLAIANEGYEFVKWQDSKGNEVSTDNPFTLTNVTHDSTITAVFKKISSSTSIADKDDAFEISIYPNPTTDYVTISYGKDIRDATLAIYTQAGVLAHNIPAFSGETIDLSHLANGIYVLEIISEDGIFVEKLIIN